MLLCSGHFSLSPPLPPLVFNTLRLVHGGRVKSRIPSASFSKLACVKLASLGTSTICLLLSSGVFLLICSGILIVAWWWATERSSSLAQTCRRS